MPCAPWRFCTARCIFHSCSRSMGCTQSAWQRNMRNGTGSCVRSDVFCGKSQKTTFEINLQQTFDLFLEEAERVTEDVRSYGSLLDARECEESGSFCHGDYQHHNLLCQNTTSVINFEKCALDSQMRDLYLFLRKLLEKTNWSVPLARGLLDVYGRISPLSAVDYLQLYYRFAYPEKFWKIVNFYYNSRKVWIPGRHMEKLERLLIQQGVKKAFLEQTFSL